MRRANYPSRRNCGALLFGIACLATGSSASADDWAQDVQGWTVGRSGDDCLMTMDYEGAGATQVTLHIDGDSSDDTFIFITNYGWSAKKGAEYELDYQFDEWRLTRLGLGVATNSIRKGFISKMDEKMTEQFVRSSSLRIEMGNTLIDQLSLKGTAAAVAVLERCRKQVRADVARKRAEEARLAHIPSDPFAPPPAPQPVDVAGAPTPRGYVGAWANTSDYPSAAIRERREGVTRFRLTIDTTGRASDCHITESSGHADLDATTCELVMRRARFDPAVDSNGDATTGIWESAVSWTLPD